MSASTLKRLSFVVLLWLWVAGFDPGSSNSAFADECDPVVVGNYYACGWCSPQEPGVRAQQRWRNFCTGEEWVEDAGCDVYWPCQNPPEQMPPGPQYPACYNSGAVCSDNSQCCSGACSWLHGGICMSCWEYCQGMPGCTC